MDEIKKREVRAGTALLCGGIMDDVYDRNDLRRWPQVTIRVVKKKHEEWAESVYLSGSNRRRFDVIFIYLWGC